ncbi:HSF-type DNA-binding-domain-containing protein [Umbelopsis sp. PMI_123]|nr:HSF-type DNA-binding-domain-containing protein [Umbelopsis sp. PMI_123]
MQPSRSNTTTTFVHKLYNMVMDPQYQNLITWGPTGNEFVVINPDEFQKSVLPVHFKHNNFSSFVRQLNMYGFHKVNKTARGHGQRQDNHVWRFCHTNFIKGRLDLLDRIKRKAMEQDNKGKDTTDFYSTMNLMQARQTEMVNQIKHLHNALQQVMQELRETKASQREQQEFIAKWHGYLEHKFGNIGKGNERVCDREHFGFILINHLPSVLTRPSASTNVCCSATISSSTRTTAAARSTSRYLHHRARF